MMVLKTREGKENKSGVIKWEEQLRYTLVSNGKLKDIPEAEYNRLAKAQKSGLRKCKGHRFGTHYVEGKCVKCGGYKI